MKFNQLKHILDKYGISVNDLSLKLGVTPQSVYNIIYGRDISHKKIREILQIIDPKLEINLKFEITSEKLGKISI